MTHVFDPTTLREYDIRGRIGDTLSEADAHAIGRGFGTIVARGGGRTVAVGRDGRLSSPALEAALVAGVVESGIEVLRVGLGPTPMLYYAVHELPADGGIMITGSHNPVDYNGFKFMLGTGPFYGPQIQTIGAMAAKGDWLDGDGSSREVNILDRYVARLAQGYDAPPMRVVWDAGNGSAGEAVERLVRLLPGEHHLMFTEIDGTFPNHHPDPTEEKNLADLKRAVIEHRADLGLAFDGDGDRLGAVDGQGRVVWGDQVLGILAVPVLAAEPGATIIGDIKSSQTLFDRIAELGGQPLMWRTGHSNIKARMKQSRVPLAGEMSGHIFFAHDYYGFDDGLYAGVRLLRALGHIGKSLAELKDAIPNVITTPEMRFQCADTRKFAVIDEVLARLKAEGAQVNGIDGARVSTSDGWWLLRASNTQDVLVARAEARDETGVERLMTALNGQLTASGIEPATVSGH